MRSDEQTPRRRLYSLVLYVWRLAIPFWLFRNADSGTREQRIANYRYNRAQRKILPFYMWKWMGIAVCMFQLTHILSRQMAGGGNDAAGICTALFCMSAGIGFAFSCVVIAVLAVSYLYLSYVKR